MKNFDREIKNGDCFKIVNFRFLWFLDFNIDLETCMHGSNFVYPTRPGPVRSQSVQLCICYRSRPVDPNLWPTGQK